MTACTGGTAFFKVTPSGLGPFTYQWRKNGVNVSESAKIFGSDAQTLKIKQFAAGDATNYSGVVGDSCLPPASVKSGSATLTVNAGATPGNVSNLRLAKVNAGASLLLTWNNSSNSTDYIVYEDSAPEGDVTTQTGTSASGVTGLTIALPSGASFTSSRDATRRAESVPELAEPSAFY